MELFNSITPSSNNSQCSIPFMLKLNLISTTRGTKAVTYQHGNWAQIFDILYDPMGSVQTNSMGHLSLSIP